jgi:hypothetical protein
LNTSTESGSERSSIKGKGIRPHRDGDETAGGFAVSSSASPPIPSKGRISPVSPLVSPPASPQNSENDQTNKGHMDVPKTSLSSEGKRKSRFGEIMDE